MEPAHGPGYDQHQLPYYAEGMWYPAGYGYACTSQGHVYNPPMPFDQAGYQERMVACLGQRQPLQHFAGQAPAFAALPPASKHTPAWQAEQQQQQRQRGLARRKKAALPAEASYGCECSSLQGGQGSSAVLASTESSLAEGAGWVAGLDPRGSPAAACRTSSQAAGMARTGSPPRRWSDTPSTHGPNRPFSSGAASRQPSARVLHAKAPRAVRQRPSSFSDSRRPGNDVEVASRHREANGVWRASSDLQWQAHPSRSERQGSSAAVSVGRVNSLGVSATRFAYMSDTACSQEGGQGHDRFAGKPPQSQRHSVAARQDAQRAARPGFDEQVTGQLA